MHPNQARSGARTMERYWQVIAEQGEIPIRVKNGDANSATCIQRCWMQHFGNWQPTRLRVRIAAIFGMATENLTLAVM